MEEHKDAKARERSRTPKAEEKSTASATPPERKKITLPTAATQKPPTTKIEVKKESGISHEVSLDEDRDVSSPSVVAPKDFGATITMEAIEKEKDEEKKQKMMRRLEMQLHIERIAYARKHGRYPSPVRRERRESKKDIKDAKDEKEKKSTRDYKQTEKKAEGASSSSKAGDKKDESSKDMGKSRHRHREREEEKHSSAKPKRGEPGYKKPSH